MFGNIRIIDYKISEDIFSEFVASNYYDDNYWKIKTDEWTPFEEKTPLKHKWCLDIYNFAQKKLNFDINYKNTVNYKTSMIIYENGFIEEHTDIGTLSYIYNIDDGLEFYDNGWKNAPLGLLEFDGDLGSFPLKHRVRTIKKRRSLNFFVYPSNCEYPWNIVC